MCQRRGRMEQGACRAGFAAFWKIARFLRAQILRVGCNVSTEPESLAFAMMPNTSMPDRSDMVSCVYDAPELLPDQIGS